MLLGYGLLGILVLYQFLYSVVNKSVPTVSVVEALFFVIVAAVGLSFLRPDARKDVDSIAYLIATMISAAYILLAEPERRQLEHIQNIMLVFAGVFAAFVLLWSLFEPLFYDVYYPLLSDSSKAYADRYIPRGYSPVLGGSCTYMDYIIISGLSVALGKLFTFQKQKCKTKLVFAALIAFYLFAIALVGRRGELLSVVVVLVVLWILACEKSKRWIRLGSIICGGGIIIGLAVMLLPLLKEVDFLNRYVMTVEKLLSGADITSGRTELYTLALSLFAQKPVFGIGWGQFANHVTQEFRDVHGQDVANVHNIYLEFLCETGIVGAIIIIFPLVYLFILTVKQFMRCQSLDQRTTKSDLVVQLNTASLVIQLFFLIVGLLDPCFSKVIFWSIYGVSIKLLSCALRLEDYQDRDVVIRTWEKIVTKFSKIMWKQKK